MPLVDYNDDDVMPTTTATAIAKIGDGLGGIVRLIRLKHFVAVVVRHRPKNHFSTQNLMSQSGVTTCCRLTLWIQDDCVLVSMDRPGTVLPNHVSNVLMGAARSGFAGPGQVVQHINVQPSVPTLVRAEITRMLPEIAEMSAAFTQNERYRDAAYFGAAGG